ncbi:hypothetical protein J6590_054188 [Homalodisca vitripennis]|nr:hypothetical protein J6590_054188 [Homalodisca vitripennis]
MAKLKVISCQGQHDPQEARPWWEPPYVIYGFGNHRVRSRMERLMGTYVVEATNKAFMVRLQQRSREVYEEDMKRRIQLVKFRQENINLKPKCSNFGLSFVWTLNIVMASSRGLADSA